MIPVLVNVRVNGFTVSDTILEYMHWKWGLTTACMYNVGLGYGLRYHERFIPARFCVIIEAGNQSLRLR